MGQAWPQTIRSACLVAHCCVWLPVGSTVGLLMMEQRHVFGSILFLLLRLAFAAASDDGHFVFNYVHHGQDWREAHCGSRERQSPIALDRRVMTLNATSKTLFFSYEAVDGDLVMQNDGHSLAVDLAGRGYGGITYEGGWYNIVNINFHAKSEHTYDGMHMPMELHLVHKRYDGPQIIVVAIPVDCEGKPDIDLMPPMKFDPSKVDPYAHDMTRTVIDFPNPALLQQRRKGKTGLRNGRKSSKGPWYPANERPYEPPPATDPNSNHFMQKFVSQLPPKLMRTTTIEGSEVDPLNLNLLMEGGTYVEYEGSFTVPPCSETITWFVKREPVMASDSEVRILYETIYEMTDDFGNYRSIMPMSGRTVSIVTSKHAIPIQEQDTKLKGAVPSTRQFQGQTWAMDALAKARKNTATAKELSDRIHAAAQVHADQLDPSGGPGPPYNGTLLVPHFQTPPGYAEPPCETAACQLTKMVGDLRDTINNTAYKVVHESAERIGDETHEATIQAVHDVLMLHTPPPPTTMWPPMIQPTRSPPTVEELGPSEGPLPLPMPPSPAPAPTF